MKESYDGAPAPRTWQRYAPHIAVPGVAIAALGLGLLLPDAPLIGVHASSSDYVVQLEDVDAFNPHGSCHHELSLRRPGGLASIVLTDDPTMRYHFPALSPDGRSVAFAGTRVDPDTGTTVEHGLYLGNLQYSRLGRPMGLANTLLAVPLPDGSMDFGYLFWTPDSRYVVFDATLPARHGSDQNDVFLYCPETGEVRNLTRTPDVAEFCREPSPQSDRVAYVCLAHGGGPQRHEIYTVSITGGAPRRIRRPAHTADGINTFPTWTPDGKWLVVRDASGARWRLAADGSGRTERLPPGS